MEGMIVDELHVLEALVPLADARIVEAGCGAAQLARTLLQRHPSATVTGLDVDDRQLAKNALQPTERLKFVRAGAQAIPAPDASFDGALMLKSLHHVPRDAMDDALAELARVVCAGGWLYVSEPVYDGPLNDVTRLYNDEGEVRALAQQALDRAAASPCWHPQAERRFVTPVRFASFAEFEQRMMRPTFADHHLDDALVARVGERYARHARTDGSAAFVRPMHVRVLGRV